MAPDSQAPNREDGSDRCRLDGSGVGSRGILGLTQVCVKATLLGQERALVKRGGHLGGGCWDRRRPRSTTPAPAWVGSVLQIHTQLRPSFLKLPAQIFPSASSISRMSGVFFKALASSSEYQGAAETQWDCVNCSAAGGLPWASVRGRPGQQLYWMKGKSCNKYTQIPCSVTSSAIPGVQ